MDITVIQLLMAVNVTDKATSPFAKYTIMLEVAPPAQATNTMTPTAYSGLRPN